MSFLPRVIFPQLQAIDAMRWRNLEYFQRLDENRRYPVSCGGLSRYTFAQRADRAKAIRVRATMFDEARANPRSPHETDG